MEPGGTNTMAPVGTNTVPGSSDATKPGSSAESPEWVAIDTSRLKALPFDLKVLMADEYYILYQISGSRAGDMRFEKGDDVRSLTFEEGGRGCFWTDDEKGRSFSYEADGENACRVSFDDGGKASFSLHSDQGGALPRISEEGHIWLALSLEDQVFWFY